MTLLIPSAQEETFGIDHVRTLFYIYSFTQYVRKIYNSYVVRKLTNYAQIIIKYVFSINYK